jgi:glycosyltransferase 2 family protein
LKSRGQAEQDRLGYGRESAIENLRKNWVKLALSTLALLLGGGWLASKANIQPHEVLETVRSLGWRTVLAALACNLAQTFFIIARYYVLIPAELHPGARRVTYAIGLGHALNTVLPARAGDVLKCFWLSQGKRNRLSLLSSAGVLIADRILDVAVLLSMAVGWQAYRHPKMKEWIAVASERLSFSGISVGILLLVVVAAVLFFKKRPLKQSKWTGEFRTGFACLRRPPFAAVATLLAFFAWSGEILSVQLLASSQGIDISFANALFVILALNLAISIPVSVANVGPFEAAIALALASFGMASSQALAVATVHHGLQITAIGGWALVALVMKPPREALGNVKKV